MRGRLFSSLNPSFYKARACRRFYIDFTGGDDAHDGHSPATAWQSIAKVNAYSFKPGDRILFKRSEVWPLDASLVPPASGLFFGSYGSGDKPVLDGQDTVDCVITNGKHHLTFATLEVTQGLDFGFSVNGWSTHCLFENIEAHDCGNDSFLFSEGSFCAIYGGQFYNTYVRVDDSRHITGIEIKDGSHDILINNAECYGSTGDAAPTYGSGIGIHNHSTPTEMPYNITLKNCNCHDQGLNCFGLQIKNQADVAMTDRKILIEHCFFHANNLDGIQIANAAGFTHYVTGVVIRDCAFTDNGRSSLAVTGDVIDVYRNLFTSAYAGVQCSINASVGVNWWNNTHYDTADNSLAIILALTNARLANVSVKNNLFATSGTNTKMINHGTGCGTTDLVIDYNLYSYTSTGLRWVWNGANKSWTTWLSDSGQDAHSPARGDPLFVTPGSDFTLQDASPAINIGVDVGLSYLGVAPDCGCFEKM